jgi:hypothetical protein
MKMTRKIATVLFIVFLISTWTVYAGYTIFTNTVEEIVSEYTFETLVKDASLLVLNTNFTFTSTLKFGGVGIGAQTVYLLRNINGTSWVKIMTNTTESNGNFRFTVNRTSLGTIQYKAGFDVP